jgi:hypothetical protein
MRITTSTLALLALPVLIHAEAVSLIDFIPRVENVSGACNKVYQQDVTGCDSQDFKQKSCSVTCVKALASMTKLVKDACSNEGFLDSSNKDSNILALFLQDRGPQNLCGNANDVLQSQAQSSPSAAPTTPTSYSSTAETTQPSTTDIVSSVSTASSTDVPTSLVVDTSSSPGATSSTSSTASAESGQSTTSGRSSATSQIFEAPSMPASWTATSVSSQATGSSEHSGGGSPFDVAAAQFSSAAATSSSAVLLIVAITFTLFAA